MAGIYKMGFPGDTPVAKAKKQALARIRADQRVAGLNGEQIVVPGDHDDVTAGPEIIQTPDHEEAGEYLVRIVTGVPDPLAARQTEPEPSTEDRVLTRLAQLTPEHLAALDQILATLARPAD